MDEPFLRIARSFLEHPTFLALDHRDKCIMYFVLEKLCYKEQDFDDHGIVIHLMPGQLCMTKRDIAKKTNTSLNEVHRLFLKMEKVGFLIQEVKKQKTVLTYVWNDIYNHNETRNETGVKQERNRIETETKNERRKEEENIKKTIVRHGGNVDNSQASYQHSPHALVSPFLQKTENEEQVSSAAPNSLSPSENALFDPSDTLKIFRVLQEFRYEVGYCKGMGLTDRDKRAWITLTKDNPQDLLEALSFYKKQEKQTLRKSRTYQNPPGFITTIICERLWEKKKAQDKAKKADQEHNERLRANGAI
jgi:hypothetical protein